MATHSSILAWEIPWDRHKRVRHYLATKQQQMLSCLYTAREKPSVSLQIPVPSSDFSSLYHVLAPEPASIIRRSSWSNWPIKMRRHYFANKDPSIQSYGFSSHHVWMWELDYKQNWAQNWCFWTVVLENTLDSPTDSKEIQPVHPKGNQCWIFIGRTDAESETSILWPSDVKNWLTGKDPEYWERLKAGGEGDDRGWDGWMASLIQWTWVWINSGSWWWTGSPGMLWSMGSQRVRHNWATELDWIGLYITSWTNHQQRQVRFPRFA